MANETYTLRSYRDSSGGTSNSTSTGEEKVTRRVKLAVEIHWGILAVQDHVHFDILEWDSWKQEWIKTGRKGIKGIVVPRAVYHPLGPYSFNATIEGDLKWVYTTKSIRVGDDTAIKSVTGFQGTMTTSTYAAFPIMPLEIKKIQNPSEIPYGAFDYQYSYQEGNTWYLDEKTYADIETQIQSLGMITSFVGWHPQNSEDIATFRDFFGITGIRHGFTMYDIEFLQFYGYDASVVSADSTSALGDVNSQARAEAISKLLTERGITQTRKDIINASDPNTGIHVPIQMTGLYRKEAFEDNINDDSTWLWKKCFNRLNPSCMIKIDTDKLVINERSA